MRRILAILSAGSTGLLLALLLCAQLLALPTPAIAADCTHIATEAGTSVDADPTRPAPLPGALASAAGIKAFDTHSRPLAIIAWHVPATTFSAARATGPPA